LNFLNHLPAVSCPLYAVGSPAHHFCTARALSTRHSALILHQLISALVRVRPRQKILPILTGGPKIEPKLNFLNHLPAVSCTLSASQRTISAPICILCTKHKKCGFKKIALQALPSSLQRDIFISLGLFGNKVQGHDR